MIRLSVLDQSTTLSGRAPGESIRETLALARHCEALGYARYWVSEHHNSESVAGSAPEILIAAIAATTQRIRVGSAGVMLPHYSSLKVAEQFRVLEAIAPGRIDLGFGRAPGSDGRTAYALNPNAAAAVDQFPAQVRDLLAWVDGAPLPDDHPFRTIRAQPEGDTAPEVWALGSSDYGAQLAAYFGLPYCFAHFITDGRGADRAMRLYRENFRPGRIAEPHGAACVWALAADSEEEAWRLFRSREAWRLGVDRGVFAPLPSPEEAMAHELNPVAQARVEQMRANAICGTARTVAAKLTTIAETLGIEEIVVLTAAHDPEARRRSYALIAEAMRPGG